MFGHFCICCLLMNLFLCVLLLTILFLVLVWFASGFSVLLCGTVEESERSPQRYVIVFGSTGRIHKISAHW